MFTGEILAHMVGQDTDIRGVPVQQLKNVLSQFADDSGAFLRFESTTINEFCKVLSDIEASIGLQVSYEKTTLYRVGSLANSKATLYTEKCLKWSSASVEMLGISVACDGSLDKTNYDKILEKMKKISKNWYNRRLTLFGKVLVVNTLMASLAVYKMMCLASMSEEQRRGMEAIIRDFIWSGRKPKISLYTMSRKKSQGGLQLVDVKAKQQALQIQAIFQCEPDSFLHHCMHSKLVPSLGSVVWRCNINKHDVKKHFDTSGFWAQALLAWAQINYIKPQTPQEVRKQILWCNSDIRIQNDWVVWNNWLACNILYIEDIVNIDGEWLSWEEIVDKYPLIAGGQWLNYQQLLNAILANWGVILKDENVPESEYCCLYDRCLMRKKITPFVYNLLIDDTEACAKYLKTWEKDGFIFPFDRYVKGFSILYKCSQVTKLRDYQYRLLLNKIVMNYKLKEWNLVESDACTFCKNEVETVAHILFGCKKIQNIKYFINELCRESDLDEIDIESYLLNDHCKPSHAISEILLIIKQKLYAKPMRRYATKSRTNKDRNQKYIRMPNIQCQRPGTVR